MKRALLFCVPIALAGAACGNDPVVPAGAGTTIFAATEPPGERCPNGGTVLHSGVDYNGDGQLTGAEIQSSSWLCAATGAGSLETFDEPPGENCPHGGVGITTPGASEAVFVCHPAGAAGTLLHEERALGYGDDNCTSGYVETRWGLDSNEDGELSDDEVTARSIACNSVPFFDAPDAWVVDDCSEDFDFDLGARDLEDGLLVPEVRIVSSGAATTLEVHEDGSATLPGGRHESGLILEVTATDRLGASRSRRVSLSFGGAGCVSLQNFFGVNPDSCQEVDINGLAGDDRGGPVMSANYVFYSGDDGTVRLDRSLGQPELVTYSSVDTLFADRSTGQLYALVPADSAPASLMGYGGYEFTYPEGPFAYVAEVNEETLEIGELHALSVPIETSGSTVFELGGTSYLLHFDKMLMGADQGKLALLIAGNISAHGDPEQVGYIFLEIDPQTGATTNWRVHRTPGPNLGELNWRHQETQILPMHAELRSGEWFFIFRHEGSREWIEYDFEAGVTSTVSSTYAMNCDTSSVVVDYERLQAFGHAEYGCFVAKETPETLFACDLLFEQNDGSVNDSGYMRMR